MLHAIIMAGGSGTRFWPKSRRNRPKQLLRLFGDATMLQQTVDRIEPLVPAERILIVTGADQAEAVAGATSRPAGRRTSSPSPARATPRPASAWRPGSWRKQDPEGTMIVMPADHVIEPAARPSGPPSARRSAVIEEDPTTFVTFGIKPTRPETGYGYIERGRAAGHASTGSP